MEPVKAIEMKGISKAFGSVKANENVNLTVYNGEIHALSILPIAAPFLFWAKKWIFPPPRTPSLWALV